MQAQTVGFEFDKVFQIQSNCFVGLTGLATDIQTVYVHFSAVRSRARTRAAHVSLFRVTIAKHVAYLPFFFSFFVRIAAIFSR